VAVRHHYSEKIFQQGEMETEKEGTYIMSSIIRPGTEEEGAEGQRERTSN
jgi:hypothetical protein